jgi:tryptophan synthase alpha chain
MNRISHKFAELGNLNKKALITFVTAGDPDLKTTGKIIKEMVNCGADIVEIGVPYSDPIAEGPVIQRANSRALRNNINIKSIFGMVEELRSQVNIPLLFLLYYNSMLQYGLEKFFHDCAIWGIDGVIIPDLPFEEREEAEVPASACSIDIISIVTPTSKDRIEQIVKDARGFLYCVSSLGVTGVRKEFKTDFDEFFTYIDRYTKIPKAIGFGITTPEHAAILKNYCDGLIIGSAIVAKIEQSRDGDEAVKNAGDLTRLFRNVLDM